MPEDTAISIPGVARPGLPDPVYIARGRTCALQMEARCEDPAQRARIAIYAGTKADGRGYWYMPPGSGWKFFTDGIHIYPVAGRRGAFVLEPWFLHGFDIEAPSEHQIYHYGFDPRLENKRGCPLPYHFHWLECDRKNPTLHCSTEKGAVLGRASFVILNELPEGWQDGITR